VVAPAEVRDCYSEALALMPNCYFVNDYKRAHTDVLDEVRSQRRPAGILRPVVLLCSLRQQRTIAPAALDCCIALPFYRVVTHAVM
jgi:hypothetical protein